ncbi:hypothetical protein K501DRAFT_316425 [Backusella circina FSU 941]|nr:hypothetical protein K501DRAFT_316425 [Backusella circina FSU 941]
MSNRKVSHNSQRDQARMKDVTLRPKTTIGYRQDTLNSKANGATTGVAYAPPWINTLRSTHEKPKTLKKSRSATLARSKHRMVQTHERVKTCTRGTQTMQQKEPVYIQKQIQTPNNKNEENDQGGDPLSMNGKPKSLRQWFSKKLNKSSSKEKNGKQNN